MILQKRKKEKLFHQIDDGSQGIWFLWDATEQLDLHFVKNTYNPLIQNICSRSSVGLERLPAKEEVTGSSPVGCTIRKIKSSFERMGFLFFYFPETGLESELISLNPLNGIQIQWGEAGHGQRSDQVQSVAPFDSKNPIRNEGILIASFSFSAILIS